MDFISYNKKFIGVYCASYIGFRCEEDSLYFQIVSGLVREKDTCTHTF